MQLLGSVTDLESSNLPISENTKELQPNFHLSSALSICKLAHELSVIRIFAHTKVQVEGPVRWLGTGWFAHSTAGFSYTDVAWRISAKGNLRPLLQNVLTLHCRVVHLFSEEHTHKIRLHVECEGQNTSHYLILKSIRRLFQDMLAFFNKVKQCIMATSEEGGRDGKKEKMLLF